MLVTLLREKYSNEDEFQTPFQEIVAHASLQSLARFARA